MPMNGDDLYWNSIDFGSDEESVRDMPSSTTKHYVDPWDLENYAYIRQHLHSVDLSSDPSTSGEFAEANTSFYYIPGIKKPTATYNQSNKYDAEQGNYADIEDVKAQFASNKNNHLYSAVPAPETDYFETDIEENPYEDEIFKDNSLQYVYESRDKYRRMPNFPAGRSSVRDRSLSFSYGDYGYDQDIYSKLEDSEIRKDSTLPMYDDARNRRKPNNFGLSNYGHLKIDYSYSWNNLNKYICN